MSQIDSMERGLDEIGFHICEKCGATILYDRGAERPSRPEEVHAKWHRQLERAWRESR